MMLYKVAMAIGPEQYGRRVGDYISINMYWKLVS